MKSAPLFASTKSAKTNRLAAGFTIVELMIATLVFSVILLIITSGVIHFTTAYYKGINSSTTQNVARNIVDTVAQAIQFSGDMPTKSPIISPTKWVCIGNQQFTYQLGGQLPTAPYALSQISNTVCNSPSPPPPTELLQAHMRLAQFSVDLLPGDITGTVWTVTAKLAYGDNDLLCAPKSYIGSCAAGAAKLSDAQLAVADVTCKSTTGSQFCDVAGLSTTVKRRLNIN